MSDWPSYYDLFRIEDTVIARLFLHSPFHHREYELFVLNETIKDLLLVKMRPLLKKRECWESHEAVNSRDSTEYCQHDRVNAQIDACELAHTDHHWTGTLVLKNIHCILGDRDLLVAIPVKKNTPGQISLIVRQRKPYLAKNETHSKTVEVKR